MLSPTRRTQVRSRSQSHSTQRISQRESSLAGSFLHNIPQIATTSHSRPPDMFPRLRPVLLLVLAPTPLAHLGLIHPSMYGWTDDPNQADFVTPLADMPFGDGTNG